MYQTGSVSVADTQDPSFFGTNLKPVHVKKYLFLDYTNQ